jgi:tRNA(Ile)-lysidine synthase
VTGGITDGEFSELMDRLGPFEPAPRIAAAVSGGADSMALAFLANRWVSVRGGRVLALIVDHRLRAESSAEAADTAARLGTLGIASRILELTGLTRGPRLAERARQARYTALLRVCREEGFLHLLLGHHAADQAETVIMRGLSESGAAGLAAMAGVVETQFARLLRPFLTVAPGVLRATLTAAGIGWVEDPSNTDPNALRPRLRALRRDRDGTGPATAALTAAACAAGHERARQEGEIAELVSQFTIRPEGFAVLDCASMPVPALGALVQAISGAPFPPRRATLAALAGSLRPATVAGVRLMHGGRLGRFLIVREAAAVQPPVPARSGAVWDRRFRLGERAEPPEGAIFGALGDDAVRMRHHSELPSAVLRVLPAVRDGGRLLAVPHLDFPDAATCAAAPVLFAPPRPVAGAPFFTA